MWRQDINLPIAYFKEIDMREVFFENVLYFWEWLFLNIFDIFNLFQGLKLDIKWFIFILYTG